MHLKEGSLNGRGSLLFGGNYLRQCFPGVARKKLIIYSLRCQVISQDYSRAWHHYSCGTDFEGMESARLMEL